MAIFAAANHVRLRRRCVETSDVDILGNLDCVIELDAGIAGHAIDLGIPKQDLEGYEITTALVQRDECVPNVVGLRSMLAT